MLLQQKEKEKQQQQLHITVRKFNNKKEKKTKST
jgi:hypothetical protein